MLTQKDLKAQLSYNPETGFFTWVIRKPKVKYGSIAGRKKPSGYVEIRLNLVSYQAHRLAWLYMTGAWPEGDIDHINSIRDDNRLCNLRQANRAQNLCNVGALASSSTGIRGVDLHKATGRYRARIRVDGKRIELGQYDTAEEAGAAYRKAQIEHHGDFRK